MEAAASPRPQSPAAPTEPVSLEEIPMTYEAAAEVLSQLIDVADIPHPTITQPVVHVMPVTAVPVPPPVPQVDEHMSDDSDDDGSDSESEKGGWRWRPIKEDTSLPCADELAYIASQTEHSAADHAYWEKEAFFDLEDPDLKPLAHGRIDWRIDRFRGTAEHPNVDRVMRSPVVSIGGLDWQIKFFPRGNHSDYLSVYVECVSMRAPEWKPTEEFTDPPFPFLAGTARPQCRRSVAAQIAVVMYNPAEPRVYEAHTDAHQFCAAVPDFGWTYFSRESHYDFHVRQHKQRCAILQNDTLAFAAYIRIVDDPTRCLWEHPSERAPCDRPDDSTIVGLRPCSTSTPAMVLGTILLHFKPIRDLVRQAEHTDSVGWLQRLLLKMYSRQPSKNRVRDVAADCDVMQLASRLSTALQDEADDGHKVADQLLTTFGMCCGTGSLDTKKYRTVKDAVQEGRIEDRVTGEACPPLLMLELDRQEHDPKTRRWKKLVHAVEVDERFETCGHTYALYAFITHRGPLAAGKYNAFVRPRGPQSGWYHYRAGRVVRLTEAQARKKHSGGRVVEESNAKDGRSPPDPLEDEVCCVAVYVRNDYEEAAFAANVEEEWTPSFLPTSTPDPAAATGDSVELPATETPPEKAAAAKDTPQLDLAPAARAPSVTPEPPDAVMHGDDVLMSDAAEPSSSSVHSDTTDSPHHGEARWLGQPFYTGALLARRPHGHGTLIDTAGNSYTGSFSHGRFSGEGTMIYAASGDTYTGSWDAGAHHGKGVYVSAATGNVCEGTWAHGRQTGAFVLRGNVTEEDRMLCSICYDRKIDTAFYDCGHVLACGSCADVLDDCPVCRKEIRARVTLFGVRVVLEGEG